MMSRFTVFLLAACGCSQIPQDPEGTFDRVRAERSFRVGMIASPAHHPAAEAIVQRVEQATGARASVEQGALEALLTRLEEGKLDLVVGEVSPKSPWAKRVTLLPPVAERVELREHQHISLIARNGENRWIGLLHRQARQLRAQT